VKSDSILYRSDIDIGKLVIDDCQVAQPYPGYYDRRTEEQQYCAIERLFGQLWSEGIDEEDCRIADAADDQGNSYPSWYRLQHRTRQD